MSPEAPVTLSPRVHPLLEVIRYYLWLGTTGFGGPVVLCSLMERDLVEQRGWLDKEQMRDVIAVCQTMPGPLAVQVATFIGYMRCGFWGAWSAGWALILPASVMVGLLIYLHDLPWLTAVIYGVSPAVIWLLAADFLTAIAVGMVTPGPVMTAATFAGYVVVGPVGAVVCTIAIYLPSFLLVLLAAPTLMRHRATLTVQGFVKGVYAAAMGAILGATIVLGSHAIKDWMTAAIATIGFFALLWFRVRGPLLVGGAAVIGLAVFQIG